MAVRFADSKKANNAAPMDVDFDGSAFATKSKAEPSRSTSMGDALVAFLKSAKRTAMAVESWLLKLVLELVLGASAVGGAGAGGAREPKAA